LVVVGSSLVHCKWNRGAEGFLKKFRHDLAQKAVALFVSSVSPIAAREGNSEEVAKTRKIALDDRIAKYGLHPQLVGVFGGVLDFPAMGGITRKAMEVAFKARLQAAGFPESRPGVYDLRDWEEIRRWAHSCAHLCDSAPVR
jgi:menaquinone-dependent protoporphyrinogen IX oxidase